MGCFEECDLCPCRHGGLWETGVVLRPEHSQAGGLIQCGEQRGVPALGQATTPSASLGQERTCVLWARCVAGSERTGALGPILDGG